jgi:hypothetical protein
MTDAEKELADWVADNEDNLMEWADKVIVAMQKPLYVYRMARAMRDYSGSTKDKGARTRMANAAKEMALALRDIPSMYDRKKK